MPGNNSGAYVGQNQVTTPEGVDVLSSAGTALAQGGVRLIAMYTAYRQLQALKSNLATAEAYYGVNHQDFTFWATTYGTLTGGSGGRMDGALREGMTRPFYTVGNFTPQYGALDYLASMGRGESRASLKYDREWFNTRRRVGKYNFGQGRRVDLKYATARLNAEFEGWNIGFRFEDNRKMMYDEQRHAHQAEILNLGIGAGNAARAGLATAVRGLSEAKAQKAGQFGALSNGLATFAGYQDQTQGIRQRTQNQYKLATSGGQNTGISGGIPDVSQSQIDRASGAV